MRLDRFLDRSEQESFESACNAYPDRAIRLRDDRVGRVLPFEVEPIAWSDCGRWVKASTLNEKKARNDSIRPAAFLNYAVGDYYIQDAGSLLPIELLSPQPDQWICDLCAAPGGKASAIVESLRGTGLLVANESIRSRVDVLQHMLSRTGNANYIATSYDPEDLVGMVPEAFDAVLVDAPCSGQMLVGKEKRNDNAWATSQIEHSAKRQNRILDAAIQLVRPGGRIVYSTCTFSEEENEAQIARLKELYPGCFEPLTSAHLANGSRLDGWRSPVEEGCWRLWPHRDRCAGGFAGGLIRTDEPLTVSLNEPKRKPKSNQSPRGHIKSERTAVEELRSFGTITGLEARLWGQSLSLAGPEVWKLLDRRPWLGTPPVALYAKGSRWLPSHALALLRSNYFRPHLQYELPSELANRFVAGEAIQDTSFSDATNFQSTDSKWGIATWQSQSIGWAKSATNRWNNHLPAWAIQTNLSDS